MTDEQEKPFVRGFFSALWAWIKGAP